MTNNVWVFNGDNSRFAGGVFTDILKAEKWIKENRLSGILTCYPVDTGVYQWAIDNKRFTPKSENHYTSEFIGGFTTASQQHHHYENGERS